MFREDGKITAALVDNITHNLPAHPIYGTEDWEVTRNLRLADPSFHKPGHIDALIGMDVLSDVLINGLHTGKPTELKTFNTVFGWAVAGQYQGSPYKPLLHLMLCVRQEKTLPPC